MVGWLYFIKGWDIRDQSGLVLQNLAYLKVVLIGFTCQRQVIADG